ncbi:MAG: hypothetical protein ACLUV8_13655 [Clostridium sp.]
MTIGNRSRSAHDALKQDGERTVKSMKEDQCITSNGKTAMKIFNLVILTRLFAQQVSSDGKAAKKRRHKKKCDVKISLLMRSKQPQS